MFLNRNLGILGIFWRAQRGNFLILSVSPNPSRLADVFKASIKTWLFLKKNIFIFFRQRGIMKIAKMLG